MKIVEAADLDLSAYIRAGDMVTWGQASAEPQTLVETLIEQRHDLGGVDAFVGLSLSGLLKPEHCDAIRPVSYGALGTTRALQAVGKLRLIPAHYSTLPHLMRSGALPVDVALVQLSPPGPDGSHSLGFCADLMQAALDRARVVIAEINDRVPWTRMGKPFDASRVDVAIEVSRPVADREPPVPGDVERRVAEHVAGVIRDGATLQYGVGAIPAAIFEALRSHRDLGLHTGLLTEDVIDLYECGAMTNARKPVHTGIGVGSLVIGGERVRRFLHDNPELELHPVEVTHNPTILGRIDNLVAINSAVEVDLYGQVNAERLGDRHVGAIGGQVDFMHAGAVAENGLSIIAMPSSSGKSGASRIVSRLNSPAVTTARADVDMVVTEHGVADLRGKTEDEVSAALIAIAPPEHRDALRASWTG